MEDKHIYEAGQEISLSPKVILKYSEGWQQPTPEEIRTLLRITDLTGGQAANLIGVTGRTIRRYVGGEKPIHYAEWRLLLIYAGLATAETLES